MPKTLVAHLPHLAFVAVGVVAYFWAARRQPRGSARPHAPTVPEPSALEPIGLSVRRSVARRGMLALVPLLAAAASGAVIYGVNLARERSSAGVIWIHVGISVLALVLVAYKLVKVGGTRLRQGLTLQRAPGFLSLLLGALFAPLLATGILLLLAPSTGSFAAYSHLVVSAWWTGLLSWHLWRYLRPSLRALLTPAARPAVLAPSEPAPDREAVGAPH